MCVAEKSQQLDVAKQFGGWWITPDAQTAFAKKLGDTPANPKAQSDNPILKTLLSWLSTDQYTLYQGDSVRQKIQDLADSEWAKRGGPAPAASPTS